MDIHMVLQAAGVLKKEEDFYLPLSIKYQSGATADQIALFPVFSKPFRGNENIFDFLKRILPSTTPKIDKIRVNYNGEWKEIRDNSGFICACLLHCKNSSNYDVLKLCINDCTPTLNQGVWRSVKK